MPRTPAGEPREFVVFLRAISNVPMQPMREALERLGLTDVASHGGTGNLMFNAKPGTDPEALEQEIAEVLGTTAFLRHRADVARIIAEDPFAGLPDGSLMLLERPLTRAERDAFARLEFEDVQRPVVRGRTLYFRWPSRLAGRSNPTDFERILGQKGTFRATRVVRRVHERMSER